MLFSHSITFSLKSMPNIQAFRGLRYNLGHVGELEAVLSPAPTAIDAEAQNAFYKNHPCNFVRLISNRSEPGDEEGDRLNRAVRYFRNWKREGVFERDGEAAIYVFEVNDVCEVDDANESSPSAIGFFAITQLASLSDPNRSASQNRKDDMVHTELAKSELALLERCEANLNPVASLLEDSDSTIESLLFAQVANKAPVQAEMNGFKFKTWIENDLHFISNLTAHVAQANSIVIQNQSSLLAAEAFQEAQTKSLGDVIPQTDSVLSAYVCLPGLRLSELSIEESGSSIGEDSASRAGDRYHQFADGLVRIPCVPSGIVVNVFD